MLILPTPNCLIFNKLKKWQNINFHIIDFQ